MTQTMAEQVPEIGNVSPNDIQQLNENNNSFEKVNRSRAYLNFALFDDQFNLVSENSGLRQLLEMPDSLQTLTVDKMPIDKTGFLYVYTCNESGQDVYMDNLVVGMASGPLLEETHYYPFGLTMYGISRTAPGRLENKYLFAGKEIQRGEFGIADGLELYDFGNRMHYPRTARYIH